MKNIINFLSKKFPFLIVKFSRYLNRHVFIIVYIIRGTLSEVCIFKPFSYSICV